MKVPLSPNALRLLEALHREAAYGPAWAVKQATLAELIDRPVREIVILAAELLEAGILVLATCGDPPGCFLLRLEDDLTPAQTYLKSLRQRALSVLGRYRLVKGAIEHYELQRRRGLDGQLTLDLPGDAA